MCQIHRRDIFLGLNWRTDGNGKVQLTLSDPQKFTANVRFAFSNP